MNGSGKRDVLADFDEIYATHGVRLKSIAWNLLGNRADAEDAVQETFLKALRSRGGFKGEAAPFTWLYRILVNSCLDQGRRRRRRSEDQELEEAEPLGPVSSEDHPLRLALESALDGLRPRWRTVFVLAEVEGLTHREIGDVLGIAEGTSKNDLFQAKNELRRRLGSTRSACSRLETP